MTEVLSVDHETLQQLELDPRARELLFTEARTANTFTDEPVSDEQLRAIYELTKWAPTSANTQPLRVLHVGKGPARERLVRHLAEGNRAKSETAPVVAVLTADFEFSRHLPTVFPMKPEMKDYFDADEGAREQAARFNSILQAGYFILGVRAAGLAAGPMLGFDGEGIDQEFFAGTPQKTILVVNIGHPGENPWFDRLPRLDYDQVVTHV